jgi:hypothetical protein
MATRPLLVHDPNNVIFQSARLYECGLPVSAGNGQLATHMDILRFGLTNVAEGPERVLCR